MNRNTRRSLLAILAVAGTACTTFAQVYQKNDTTPIGPGGVPNPPTVLQAVTATVDGGYIAVGGEPPFNIHIARYHADGTVMWSKFCPMPAPAMATGIAQLIGGPGLYAVVGEISDGLPYGAFFMIIDDAGSLICSKEFSGSGSFAPAGRSPVAVRALSEGTFAVTGRAKLAATGPGYGRITKFSPSCTMIWNKLYAPGGIAGLTDCEITDVVEDGDIYLLATGTVTLDTGGTMPFLLRVTKATGTVVFAKYFGSMDPGLKTRGDGIDVSHAPTGAVDGYIFDGRMNPSPAGAPMGSTLNYVVKVEPLGLGIVWGEVFPEFEPCHACVRTFSSTMLLAGTHSMPGGGSGGFQGALLDTGFGGLIWNWDYGSGSEHGNGVSITTLTPVSPIGPIIVGQGAAVIPSGFLVKSDIATGHTGVPCETPMPVPSPTVFELPATFTDFATQQQRGIVFPLTPEVLTTIDACVPTHPSCCDPDFNHDGDVGTDADIAAFFACLAGSCCPTCGSADFNCDGDVGTDADIAAFFRVLGGGPC
jgi:hypothetical protein